jgi:hypothetical protein
MTIFSKTKRRLPGLCAALIVLCMLSTAAPVYAAVTGSITIEYVLSDAAFRAYKVADISGNLTKEFQDSGADIKNITNASNTQTAIELLATYADSNNLTADRTGTTQAVEKEDGTTYGRLVFDNLEPGVYLVVGDSKVSGSSRYKPASSLLLVAQTQIEQEGDDSWRAALDATLNAVEKGKYSVTSTGGGYYSGTTDPVGGNNNDVVDIGGGDVDTVQDGSGGEETVNKVNSGLPDDTDLDDESVDTVNKVNTVNTVNTGLLGSSLPQTGMLWWPVAALSAAGLILLTIGIRRRRASERQYTTE